MELFVCTRAVEIAALVYTGQSQIMRPYNLYRHSIFSFNALRFSWFPFPIFIKTLYMYFFACMHLQWHRTTVSIILLPRTMAHLCPALACSELWHLWILECAMCEDIESFTCSFWNIYAQPIQYFTCEQNAGSPHRFNGQ